MDEVLLLGEESLNEDRSVWTKLGFAETCTGEPIDEDASDPDVLIGVTVMLRIVLRPALREMLYWQSLPFDRHRRQEGRSLVHRTLAIAQQSQLSLSLGADRLRRLDVLLTPVDIADVADAVADMLCVNRRLGSSFKQRRVTSVAS